MSKTECFAFLNKDYSTEIAQTHLQGAAYVPGFLTPAEVALFQPLCKKMEKDDPEILRSRHATSPLAYPYWKGDKKVDGVNWKLMNELGKHIRKYGNEYPALTQWDPNILTPLYYRDDMNLIPHKDHDYYVGIGITITMQGIGMLSVRQNPDSKPHAGWVTGPGDAVFLRMTGMNGDVTYEDELEHEVGKALTRQSRISLVIRESINLS